MFANDVEALMTHNFFLHGFYDIESWYVRTFMIYAH